ncbi:Tetratricopeptide TPR_2 repeat protein [Chthoniobacter flavus Ellin428]|uniref:protein O-GlcNAc transferase n=1 Tax=Chthoniobacter flavus Ellin428 TaxID=497964 RepID=B4CWP2_9BACT|nr:tetratricopeptide repeat protein [Chthoniobacter flavus]EDY21834.1 Tetratricopeptide TPR_2 repeat protein [Chthoniobacter flavus Ellin428]TCO95761.1 putative O-linked N-acetylglucosamine transferase (SPINDLY family) [Chthoniobacter flavus]
MPPVTIPQALKLAIQHHEAGQLREAEGIYRQILTVDPNHAEVHHLLGVIAHQCERESEAVNWIRRALELGLVSASAWSNLGEAYRALGRFAEAIEAYRAALRHNPQFGAAYANLGLALRQNGQIGEAIEALRQGIHLLPDHLDAHRNLAACLAEQGRLDEANAHYRLVLRRRPDAADSWFDLGVVLTQQEKLDEAIAAYRRAIEIDPQFAQAHHNLGAALVDRGDWDAAMAALRQALALQSDYVEAHYNLGNALRGAGRLDEARAAYHRAIELRPDYMEAHNNLGNACKAQGRGDEALAAFRRAAECPGASAGVFSNLISLLHYLPGVGAHEIAEEHRRWNRRFSDPVTPSVRAHANDRNGGRRLRIGYVSPDLRDHTLGRNLLPLFRNRNHEDFEVICYSEVLHPDERTAEFRGLADQWREISRESDERVAEMIRQDEVDILVDLALHTAGNRLPVFAREPAPVQVSFAGYPGSAGVDAIRCRISDAYLEGGVEKNAGSWERVYLIDSFWCYDPCGMEVPVNALPAAETGRVTFASLNNYTKINEPLLKLWARVLAAVADSRLLLLSPPGSHRERVLEIMRAEGVREQRIEFVAEGPRREYLERYHRVDVMLDPFPYNGHTTSLDALWMGVPVVSRAGEAVVSRGGLSQLSNLGLRELVAFSEEEYVKIAAGLAGDVPRLAELRKTLRPRMEASVLMDGARFARGIENAFRAMWREWCEGEVRR